MNQERVKRNGRKGVTHEVESKVSNIDYVYMFKTVNFYLKIFKIYMIDKKF